MQGIYLCSCKARHSNYNLVYNDVDKKFNPDILEDCLSIDLSSYDYIIATPPCNFYSKANYRYLDSEYSCMTKHLLPGCIKKLAKQSKPFIIENVRNDPRMEKYGIFKLINKYGLFYQYIGRHIYITNILIDLTSKQHQDYAGRGKTFRMVCNDGYRQGGSNVHEVIEKFLKVVTNA